MLLVHKIFREIIVGEVTSIKSIILLGPLKIEVLKGYDKKG